VADRLALFNPLGQLGHGANPFGKDVANLQLFRALARFGGFSQVDYLSLGTLPEAEARQALLGADGVGARCVSDTIFNQSVPAAAGALLRGQPDLQELAWLRRRGPGDRRYSLIGVVHTLAPPAMRQSIAATLTAPCQPWDALVCTSPSVRDALAQMFDDYGDYLGERTRGVRPPQPQLPVAPLGVDGQAMAALADRPQVRADTRAEFGLADGDVMVLWVGRLSFYEKAFPQAMFRAVQQAKAATGARLVFVMAGWFPAAEDRKLYEEAAAAHAPDAPVRFVDGNDAERVGALWAASDIFISLVDNIQETFGLTPIEAMAAGRPVVVSDWDGYRFTVRDGEEGFLIPTLFGPAGGIGGSMSLRHVMSGQSYQAYVGAFAQHTAVHVGRAAEAIARLVRDPELRRRMGEAGRARVRQVFDWKVVARGYNALVDELAQRRQAAADPGTRHRTSPIKGDPFRDFAGFATAALAPETPLRVAPGADEAAVRRLGDVELDANFPSWRSDLETCARAFQLVAQGRAGTVGQVLAAFPAAERRSLELGLLWLAKHGMLDWLP
jgi:glycosyltransferase involved in cell wall biosynthesis